MSDLNIELCPETGICSIIKADGTKIDLMPDEVAQVKDAAGNVDAIRQALGQIDASFAEQLAAENVDQIAKRFGKKA
jgi:hypothetical protein